MPNDETKGLGSISEWNEGNFKSIRLHEAQEMINYGKINPYSMNEEKTAWKYDLWKSGIDLLYGEGNAKYAQAEVEEIENIKNMVETMMELKPPFKNVYYKSIAGKQNKFIPLIENQKRLKQFLEYYEKIVKDCNDRHGLSTRNAEEDDWRGL